MSALSAISLSKTYRGGPGRHGSITALSDVTLEVNPGEIFGLLGPNGAGKTTFIKILLSLTHPTSGRASILGREIPDVRVKARIGYLPENHRFPPYLTAVQALQLFGTLGGVPPQDLRSRIGPMLTRVGLLPWGAVKIRKYSKGMLQRLALAQALMNNPEVVFLDEPTDGVDPVGRKEIRDLLRSLKDEGKTVFLNSHLLSEVEMVSDRVAILDKGKLLKVGTVDELTTVGPVYQVGTNGDVPEDVKHELSALVMKATYGQNLLSIECASTGELNRVIDILRKRGVEITSIARQRSTLEDSFLTLLKQEGTK